MRSNSVTGEVRSNIITVQCNIATVLGRCGRWRRAAGLASLPPPLTTTSPLFASLRQGAASGRRRLGAAVANAAAAMATAGAPAGGGPPQARAAGAVPPAAAPPPAVAAVAAAAEAQRVRHCMRLVLTEASCCPADRRQAIFRLTSWGAVQTLEAMCRLMSVTLKDNCFLRKLLTVRLGSEHTVVYARTGSVIVQERNYGEGMGEGRNVEAGWGSCWPSRPWSIADASVDWTCAYQYTTSCHLWKR